jgi:hypothetical protein
VDEKKKPGKDKTITTTPPPSTSKRDSLSFIALNNSIYEDLTA